MAHISPPGGFFSLSLSLENLIACSTHSGNQFDLSSRVQPGLTLFCLNNAGSEAIDNLSCARKWSTQQMLRGARGLGQPQVQPMAARGRALRGEARSQRAPGGPMGCEPYPALSGRTFCWEGLREGRAGAVPWRRCHEAAGATESLQGWTRSHSPSETRPLSSRDILSSPCPPTPAPHRLPGVSAERLLFSEPGLDSFFNV